MIEQIILYRTTDGAARRRVASATPNFIKLQIINDLFFIPILILLS